MKPKLDRRYPALADIEKAALKRLPKFIAEYIYCGMGNGASMRRNRETLDAIRFLPRYSFDVGVADVAVNFLDKTWQAPFGIAPVGLGGFAWPAAAQTLAAEARRFGIPFCASTFALASLESLQAAAGDCAWFQLYRPNRPEIESDMIARAIDAGYQTLMLTVDIPAPMRRAHDIRNGFSIPLQFDWFTLMQILSHPRWSLALAYHSLRHGFPEFETLARYVPPGLNTRESMHFKSELILGYIGEHELTRIRKAWPGKLIIKGVLDAQDALRYQAWGADAILVSNHGGRQLEAAPSALEQLGEIRNAVGADFPLLVDGGARSGLDICRMLASGADFVLLGRPFYYAMAAIGQPGAAHIIELLIEEIRCVMGQLGCSSPSDLRQRLI